MILGETARIDAADAMMRHKYDQVALASEYADAIGAVKFCVKARNQFAHCHWADDVYAGLFFANFRETVNSEDSTEHIWLHIDEVLAESLLSYFEYTIDLLQFLEKEYLVRIGRAACSLKKPKKRKRPPLHNPPEQHISPWLPADEHQAHKAEAVTP
jgi:hypothetical protein